VAPGFSPASRSLLDAPTISTTMEDYSQPVLPGSAPTDYERYLRTEELLALQKRPEELAHHDELLFQTVHQASELWLKLASFEIETATDHLRRRELGAARRLLGRASAIVELLVDHVRMLESMSPWEYHVIRRGLGHGSGFDSPGFNRLQEVSPVLGETFDAILAERGLDIVDVYVRGRELEDLYQLAELLLGWDERVLEWKQQHLLLVQRVIGAHVLGTQGVPVEALTRRAATRFYPALWEVRDRLTALARESEGPPATAPGHGA
jgi:tryptophan 2,3-dioxygenase